MAQRTPEVIAAELTVPDRLLLFCLASNTDWQKAPGLTHVTAQRMIIRGLIERDRVTSARFVLTDQGRAVLAALLKEGD